ncbi:uncharacterized protein LOC143186603 [Calliopsis andreniformis]|uniref:uncharacterized protein LOC143186603 n=1 Tax=Calliopsis andreniformis TaxID=337506 RepID=UPI003FCE415A
MARGSKKRAAPGPAAATRGQAKRSRNLSGEEMARTSGEQSGEERAGPSGIQMGLRRRPSSERRRSQSRDTEEEQRQSSVVQMAAPVTDTSSRSLVAGNNMRAYMDEEPRAAVAGDRFQEWVNSTALPGERNNEQPRPAIDPTARLVDAIESTLRVIRDASVVGEGSRVANRLTLAGSLPKFAGDPLEWLHFKETYDLTSEMGAYTDRENIVRLFAALKGEARDAVSTLLATGQDAATIMRTLELNFGNKNIIARKIIADIRELPELDTGKINIAQFATKLRGAVTAFRSLKLIGYLHSPDLIQNVGSKLPSALRYAYHKYSAEAPQEKTELEKLSDFVYKEAELAVAAGVFGLEPRSTSTSQMTIVSKGRGGARKPIASSAKVFGVSATSARKSSIGKSVPSCVFCDRSNHRSAECRGFAREGAARRWFLVKKHKLCFKCLCEGHVRGDCRDTNCSVCRGNHHSLLHDPRSCYRAARRASKPTTRETRTRDTSRTEVNILPVRIVGQKNAVNTFALLDEGSTITLIDRKISRDVGAIGRPMKIALKSIDPRAKIMPDCERVEFEIEGAFSLYKINRAVAVNVLSLPVQSISGNIARYVRAVENVDIKSYHDARPTILIGQDNWDLIVARELREMVGRSLALSRCSLGWALHGLVTGCGASGTTLNTYGTQQMDRGDPDGDIALDPNEHLDQLIRQYFEIDSLGVCEKMKNANEHERALRLLDETSRRVGKSWEAGLLWNEKCAPNVNGKIVAQKRLISLERKLDREPEYASLYHAEMERFIENGYAVKVNDQVTTSRPWYLPHFGVRSSTKPGKVRLVFDAAAKTTGVSLNGQLESGPDLLQSLPGILLRFRLHECAFKADIKDMFLRIKIREEDRGAQRFLWRGKNRQGSPETYEMTRLIFGAKSSPCTAIYVKNKNARENAGLYPDAVKSIINDSYMDDYLASRRTSEEAKRLIRDAIRINSEADFEMHDWASNVVGLVSSIPEIPRPGNEKGMRLCDRGGERVLGLIWDTQNDKLEFNVGMARIPKKILMGTIKPTKREFLRIIMSVYDPLGFLSPFTLNAKILMQEVWRSGIGWDHQLRDDEQIGWLSWLKGLMNIKNCRVPRCYVPAGFHYGDTQIHVFCDASLKGYAAVAYLRVATESGTRVALVMAKTRVAPLKPLSVPRLELQAALLGARLAKTVTEELKMDVNRRYLWSDSITVIRWIKSEPRIRQVFVAHRLGEIGELTLSSEWRWVPSRLNPADDATRWSSEALDPAGRWFVGPEFLQLAESNWPTDRPIDEAEKIAIDGMELRKAQVYVIHSAEYEIPLVAKFLGWPGLLVVARRVRAAFNRWKGKAQAQITVETVSEAENYWYRVIQSDVFADELKALMTGKSVNKGSRIVALKPFLDAIGILRASGRVIKLADEEFCNQPIILDAKHAATRLLIQNYHRRYYHGSNNTVVNEMRQKYYIIGLRRVLRSLISKCIICRLRRAKPQNPTMSALPAGRVALGQRPFRHCGVDYFGPMLVKIGRRREKRWGVLFTCLTTRAIHLELANSLSASSAIMALQRFAARRGTPLVVYSDNGTNFKRASKELRDATKAIDTEALVDHALSKQIKWVFNPPDAPHMGGAWERLIRSVKVALNATLRNQVPSEEVLSTLLVEIEHSVNSRPLTDVSLDPRDEEALTPNHFLIGASSGEIKIKKYDLQATCLRKQWQIAQSFANAYWRRWLREYLPGLIPRAKWHETENSLEKGDLVRIVDLQAPRNLWKTGTVTEVFPGADGVVRIAKVRTSAGVFTRPARKLIRLSGSSAKPPSSINSKKKEAFV